MFLLLFYFFIIFEISVRRYKLFVFCCCYVICSIFVGVCLVVHLIQPQVNQFFNNTLKYLHLFITMVINGGFEKLCNGMLLYNFAKLVFTHCRLYLLLLNLFTLIISITRCVCKVIFLYERLSVKMLMKLCSTFKNKQLLQHA